MLTTLLKNDRDNLISALQNRLIKINLFLAVIFLIIGVVILLIFRQSFPPQIPLFYSLIWGEAQLAPSFWLWFLPVGQFLILIINLLLATVAYPKEEIPSYFLAFATTSFNLIILITLLKIVYLVMG